MSPSTKSNAASASSPTTGGATSSADGKDAKGANDSSKGPFRKEDPDRAPLETVEIDLEVSRQRWAAWTIGGIVGGILLVLKLGTVGVWAGYVLIALGLYRAYQLVMSLLHPAGKIIVSPKQISLPRGAYRPHPLVLEPSALGAVYFLRRSVPWNRSAPVLVVEVGDNAMAFPRDWFASEADQRHVVHALLSHLPPVRREPDAKVSRDAAPADDAKPVPDES